MKKLKCRVVMMLTGVMLFTSNGFTASASGMICGGNHVYDMFVQYCGYEYSEAHTHTHNGELCFYTDEYERILMKCACGAETVVKNYVRTIHSVNQ